MQKCPRCGRISFHYELRSAGTESVTSYSFGQKSYQSNRRQKAVGICSNCGYIEEKKEKGCLFYLICVAFLPITLSVWFFRTKDFKLDKKWRALIILAFWIVFVVCLENAPAKEPNEMQPSDKSVYSSKIPFPDYHNAASFESAINSGEELTGKTVRFTVSEYVNSSFGYNAQAGKHLNFCFVNEHNISRGDTITVRVDEISTFYGSWIIKCTLIE